MAYVTDMCSNRIHNITVC